jgi:hypothetical protein
MKQCTRKVLGTYAVDDAAYQNGQIKGIRGKGASDKGALLDLDNSPEETYVPLQPGEGDPRVESYALGLDPAALVAKVSTNFTTNLSTATYTLAAPDAGGGKLWKILSRDISLTTGSPAASALGNPRGLAQWKNKLYGADYNGTQIYTIGANELNGLDKGSTHQLNYDPLDLSASLPSPASGYSYRGQGIIVLTNPLTGDVYAYVLLHTVQYLSSAPYTAYQASILARLTVNTAGGGVLVYKDNIATLAGNAQEIIPVTDSAGTISLLIPCIGGPQNGGSTNGTASHLDMVEPFADTLASTTLLTGDASSSTTWDIQHVAATRRAGNDGTVHILTGAYDSSYNMRWTLYKATIGGLLAAAGVSLTDAIDEGTLTEVATGTGAGSSWDIFHEDGEEPAGDRLWLLQGTQLVAGSAEDYGSNVKTYGQGTGAGEIGGDYINSFAFTEEAVKQAALGVSVKRSLQGSASAAAAASAAASAAPEDEAKS